MHRRDATAPGKLADAAYKAGVELEWAPRAGNPSSLAGDDPYWLPQAVKATAGSSLFHAFGQVKSPPAATDRHRLRFGSLLNHTNQILDAPTAAPLDTFSPISCLLLLPCLWPDYIALQAASSQLEQSAASLPGSPMACVTAIQTTVNQAPLPFPPQLTTTVLVGTSATALRSDSAKQDHRRACRT